MHSIALLLIAIQSIASPNANDHIRQLPNTGSENIAKISAYSSDSAIVLTQRGALYSIGGAHPSLMHTPADIAISDIAFRNANEGIVIGTNSTPGVTDAEHGSNIAVIALFVALGLLLLIVGFTLYFIIRLIRKRRWKTLVITVSVLAAIILGFLYFPFSKPNNGKKAVFDSGHYLGASGQPVNAIAITTDGGSHWKESALKTNFHLSGVISIPSGYVISTYGNKDHLDGDLWLVPNDTTADAKLYRASRALFGLHKTGSIIRAFGADVTVSFIGDVALSDKQGEIVESDENLDSLRVIDLPVGATGNKWLTDVRVAPNSAVLWAVNENGNLLEYQSKELHATPLPDSAKVKFIAAFGDSSIAILSAAGVLFASTNAGATWTNVSAARSLPCINTIEELPGGMLLGCDGGAMYKCGMNVAPAR